jgi:hypothetical protein
MTRFLSDRSCGVRAIRARAPDLSKEPHNNAPVSSVLDPAHFH